MTQRLNFGCSFAEPRGGLGDPCESLPARDALRFYDQLSPVLNTAVYRLSILRDSRPQGALPSPPPSPLLLNSRKAYFWRVEKERGKRGAGREKLRVAGGKRGWGSQRTEEGGLRARSERGIPGPLPSPAAASHHGSSSVSPMLPAPRGPAFLSARLPHFAADALTL